MTVMVNGQIRTVYAVPVELKGIATFGVFTPDEAEYWLTVWSIWDHVNNFSVRYKGRTFKFQFTDGGLAWKVA